jgi:hypothetical protein
VACSSLSLIPSLLAACVLKLAARGETYDGEQGRPLFSAAELVILAVAVIGCVAGIAALATGAITI